MSPPKKAKTRLLVLFLGVTIALSFGLTLVFLLLRGGDFSGGEESLPPAAVQRLDTGRKAGYRSIRSVCFSPRGQHLATAGDDEIVRVWDVESGKEIWRRAGGAHVAFSPDGEMLAASDRRDVIHIWRASDGELSHVFSPNPNIEATPAVLPQEVSEPVVANGKHKQLASEEEAPRDVCKLFFNEDGKSLVVVTVPQKDETPAFQIWDAKSGEMRQHAESAGGINVDPDATDSFSGGFYPIKQIAAVFRTEDVVMTTLEYGYDYLPNVGCSALRLYALERASETLRYVGHGIPVIDVGVASTSTTLGSSGQSIREWKKHTSIGSDGSIHQWNTGVVKEPNLNATSWPGAICLASGGYVTGNSDGKIRIGQTQSIVFQGHEGAVTALDRWWKPREQSASRDGRASATSKKSALYKQNRDPQAPREPTIASEPRPENRFFVLSGGKDRSLKLWAAPSMKEVPEKIHSWDELESAVTCVELSSDGKLAACGTVSGTLVIYDTQAGREILNFDSHKSPVMDIAFSEDAKKLASVEKEGILRLWHCETGMQLQEINSPKNSFTCVAMPPDGNQVICGGEEGFLAVWNLKTGHRLLLSGHQGKVNKVVAPRKGLCISCGDDGTVRRWDVGPKLLFDIPYGRFRSWKVTAEFSRSGNYVAWAPESSGRAVYLAPGPTKVINEIEQLPKGEILKKLEGLPNSAHVLAFSRDEKLLAASCKAPGTDDRRTVIIWNTQSGDVELEFALPFGNRCDSLAFSPDGRRMATGLWDGTALIWDLDILRKQSTRARAIASN